MNNAALQQQAMTRPSMRNPVGGGLKKGIDSLTRLLERKIDRQILTVQTRAYDASAPSPAPPANAGTKHIYS